MTTTPSTLKRLFVGPDAKYAQTGVEEDIARVAGLNGDIFVVNSDEDDGDSVTVRAPLRLRGGGVFNVMAYGAKGDGTTDDTVAIQAAITASAVAGGTVVYPPGTYRVGQSGAVGILRPKSNTVWQGAGRGLTVLYFDDSLGGTDMVGNNINNGATYDALTNWTMRGITMRGRGATVKTQTVQLMRVAGSQILVEDCGSEYSRNMGMVITNSTDVTVRRCRIYRTMADGIAVWDSAGVTIVDNECVQCNDDSISVHSNDAAAEPVRSGVVVSNNRIREGQGIAVSGAKAVTISNNVLQRIMAVGIRCRAPSSGTQGQTAMFSIRIVGNIINDVFQRKESPARTASWAGIWVTAGTRQKQGGAAPPGEPDTSTGDTVSLYGSNGVGTLYLNETVASTGDIAPAARGVDISGNVIERTLPAVTTVSQWGYPDSASGLWIGPDGDGSGFFNGAIPDSALRFNAITIDPAMWDSRICDNYIKTGGSYGIFLSDTGIVAMDYNGLSIERNKCIDFTTAGIYLPNSATSHRIVVRANELDGDPFHQHSNRKTGPRDGSWLASGLPAGIYAQLPSGWVAIDNSFRNLCVPIQQGGSAAGFVRGSIIYGQPAAFGFSTSNKGVGSSPYNGPGGAVWIWEECNPTSATYGQIINETVNAALAMPTTGYYHKGHFVWNAGPDPGEYIGWERLTTGNGHVLNTDWKPAGAIV